MFEKTEISCSERPLTQAVSQTHLSYYVSILECKLCALGFDVFTPNGKQSFHFVSKQLIAEQGVIVVSVKRLN